MAKQLINLGAVVNDKTGDTLRIGAQKINSNFTELYAALSNSSGQLSVVSSVTALDGISISGTNTNVVISSKIATYTDLGAVKVGDSLSITGSGTLDYLLPVASETILGGVKIDGVSIIKDETGVISAVTAITTPPTQIENGIYSLAINSDGIVVVDPSISGKAALRINADLELIVGQIAWKFDQQGNLTIPVTGDILDSNGDSVLGAFSLQIASPSRLGGVKVGSGLSVTEDGVLSAVSTLYVLPTATADTLGGVKVDNSSIIITDGTISVNTVDVSSVKSNNYFLGLSNPNFGYTQDHWLQLQAQEITSTFSLGAIAQWITFKGNVSSLDAKRIVIAPDVLDGWTMELGGPTVNQTGIFPVGDTYISKSYITDMYGTNIEITGNTDLGLVSNVTITGGTTGQVLTTDGSGNLSWTTITGSGSSTLSDLTDVVLTPLSSNQALVFDGTNWTNVSLQSGQLVYDQSLNTTDNVEFVSVTADSFVSTSSSVPTITSATNINLSAANAVVITQSPFRLASFTTVERDALTPVNGDMIYNLTLNKIQGYQDNNWINLDGSV